MGLGFILFLISIMSLVPYFIVIILKFLLWKFSFTARVNGFFSFGEVMLRVPIHLNLSLLIRMERLSFSFALNSRMLQIQTYGLQISLLIRNDFNLWTAKKIEILQILEDIRTTLKRKGILKQSYQQVASAIRNNYSDQLGNKNNEHVNEIPSSPVNNAKKTLFERTLDKLLSSFEVDLRDSIVNFYAYRDDGKKIEEGNIKKLYQSYLLDPEFRDRYLCFRVYIPLSKVNVKSMSDDELELMVFTDTLLLQHPTCLQQQGILKSARILLKVPLDIKLAQDFCNFDLRIDILRGTLNFNKKFIRSITKFIVYLDTLQVIINRIKRLITKMHYQDELLKKMRKGENPFDLNNQNFENILDIDIPKRVKINIEEGITLIASEQNKKLRPFLHSGKGDNRFSELVIINTNQVTFELLRTLKNSYYITCQCDKLSIDCNMRRSVIVRNFNQEMDFSYKKSILESPIKITKLEILNSIKIDNAYIDLTLAEAKLIFDIIDIYQEMVKVASVKHQIMGILLDKEFLKNNLLHLGGSPEEQMKESQLLLLFQEPQFKDILVNVVDVAKLDGQLSCYDHTNNIKLSLTNYKMRFKVDKGVDEMINSFDYMNIEPIKKDSLSLVKLQNLQSVISITRAHETNIEEITVIFDRSHFHLNLDYILGLTPEIMDFTFILKSFTRKWDAKYKIKEYIKKTVIEKLEFGFNEQQLVWQISKSRLLVFRMLKFITKQLQCPFKNEDKIGMCYFSKEFQIYQSKTELEQPIPGEFYCIPFEQKQIDSIFEIKDLEFKMTFTSKELKMKYEASLVEFNFPHKLHLGALIFEIVKQIIVSNKWFSKEYMRIKRKYSIQFNKPTIRSQEQYSISQQLNTSTNGRTQTLVIIVDVQEILLKAEDDPLMQLFVNKSEIVDSLQERDIFKCKPPFIFNLLKNLKQSKLNEKVMILQCKGFKFSYDVPPQFLEFNHVYQIIQRLDEAKDSMSPNIFSGFEAAVHNYKCQYIAMHARNMLKPVFEVWDADFKFILIIAVLNPKQNTDLFETKISSKIFNKYEVDFQYNKLLPKQYYDAEVKIGKARANIQGQQTMLFFNDMTRVFERFVYEDLSKARDPRGQKLNYYSGIDQLRYAMHGKCKFMINKVEGYIYPRRKFNRYDNYLSIQVQDVFYSQIHNYQELVIRNLIISKQPLRFYESALIKIPLIEVQLNIIYNQGKTVNHFIHNNVQNIQQLLEQMKTFSSEELELDAKINIPSLGHRSDSERDDTTFANLIPSFVEKSPIFIIHFQKSHIGFLIQLAKEYLKPDYSGQILLRKSMETKQRIRTKKPYRFNIKVKSLIHDVMALFTSFHERNMDGFTFDQKGRMDQRSLKQHRDKYLALYNGIMFTMENLNAKSTVSASKQKDGAHIEIRSSSMQSNFMKLAYVNTNHLYQIRHPCFKRLRDKHFENSLDNYKHFCTFFEFNPNNIQNITAEMQSNSILMNFKTLFPQYILRYPQLIQEIMIAMINPNQMNPFVKDDITQTLLEDFVFSNTDTIGTIIEISYCQDKEISFYHNLTYINKQESQKKMQTNSRSEEKQLHQKMGTPIVILEGSQMEEEKFTVKHAIDIKGTRFLYTKYTTDLIYQHLVRGFDFSLVSRKAEIMEENLSKEKDFFNYEKQQERKKTDNKKKNSQDTLNDSSLGQQPINFKNLRKVALISIRIEDPQFNFQNELTKSQMLLSSARPTTAVIFGYHQFQQGNKNQQLILKQSSFDDLHRVKSGYQIKFHEQLVKFDLQIQVHEMDIYVAPTTINLENPTFWISNSGSIHLASCQNGSTTDRSSRINGDIPNVEKEQYRPEYLLRKIISINNISFTFEFLKDEFVDNLNPSISIDMLVEKLESEMDGPNMWHFIYVLKAIFFNKGEKPEELVLIDQKRTEELQTIKVEILKNLIDQKLKQTQFSTDSKPIISKRIQYSILNGQFKVHNFESMFAQVVVSQVTGTHLIYSNRYGKVDIDIDRILIENYADSDAYRMVLFPGFTTDSALHQMAYPPVDSMIKIRTRDKYVVAKEAPWRVYDQFEVFIFPTSIQFTKNFYKQFKNFFFADMPQMEINNNAQNIKKYELLVPTKILNKAKTKFKDKAKDSDNQLVLGVDSETNQLQLKIQNQKEDFQRQLQELQAKNEEDQNYDSDEVENNKITTTATMSQFPIFFRYIRLNEVGVSITYFHDKNSFLNSKNLKVKLTPFIRFGKFVTFKKMLKKYEHHCRKNFISQIPSLIKQKFLQTKDNLKRFTDMEDDDDDQLEQRNLLKLQDAKKIVFGEFYE